MAVKGGFWYRLSLRLVPWLFGLITRLLYATCRLRFHGAKHWSRCQEQPHPCIVAFWHYAVFHSMVLQCTEGREKGWVAMVSASRDAEYVARFLENHGTVTVRGSRHKGGIAALKEMTARVAEGRHAAIVADGSQGPARQAQAGVILLAARTGAPILPLAAAADRYLAFNSWDRTMLPKPFAQLDLWFGEPLAVPADLGKSGLEQYRLELESRLNRLYETAWSAWGRSAH